MEMSKPVYRPFIGNRGQLYRVRLAFSMFKVSIEKSEALLLMISNLRLPIRVPSITVGRKLLQARSRSDRPRHFLRLKSSRSTLLTTSQLQIFRL